MALQPYRDEELNFFKFSSIVLNEFPKVLRQTFKTMWDNTYGHFPSFQLWDDSTVVRNMFAAKEVGGTKVPTHLPCSEWDCTALFQATIYARSFASHGQTLNDLYLKPHGVPHGSFHASVLSPTGNDAETFALAIDQLRLLRNSLCHSSSSEMEKTTFDQYVQYAKDAFKALGASTALIDTVESLTESDFPTNEIRKLEKGVKEETRAYIVFLENVNSDIMELRSLSAAIKEKVESDTATKDDVALLEQKIDERERILEEVSSDINEIKRKDKEFMDKLEEKISELKTAHDERNASNTNSDGIPLLRRPRLPPRVPYFTGRQKECDEIIGHLFSESTRIVSIWGSPGFGKTSVAIAVGHEIQSRGLPVFWLSLRGLQSKADLTSKLLSFLRQPLKNVFSAQHLSRDDELCQLFNEISDDLVFILDNADDLLESGLPKVNREEVMVFLEEILRRNQNVKFAITTRESFGFLDLHLEFHQSAVRIRPLEEASSRSLVHELLPDASTSDCKRITQICGHVPLAIKLLCSSISEDSAQPSQFLNELLVSSTESIVEMLDSPGYPTNHRLRFLFNSSFERLSEQEKEALVSFSVLPENFDTEVAASVLEKTERLTKNILQSLERKSLLDSSLERRLFKMHKLLQLFARERGNNEMKEIFYDSNNRFHAYYLSLFEKLNEQFLTGRSMSAFIAFYEDKQNIVQSLVDGCSYPETADRVFDVLNNAEIFLDSIFWTGSSTTCPFELIYDSALEAASRCGNTVCYGRLLVSKSFGELMWGEKGMSLKLLRQVDDIRQRATPCTRDEKAKYLCYFGMYHLVTRETESGVKCLREALPLMSNSPEHRILRLIIFQIFALYWQVEKNRSHSRQFYGKALFESMAIGDIQLVVIPSPELETANETEGRKIPNRCADRLCNKPMELQIIYHLLHASQHLPVIGTNKSLQDIVLKMRDDVEAALPCGETGLFSFHRVVVAALLNVFSKCKEKGNLAHSHTSREQKPEEKSGNSKDDTAKEYCSVSRNKHCKDPDNVENKQCILLSSGALQSRQRATDIAIERFGPEHPITADSYHTLGITQLLLGDFTSALRSLQKALNIRQVVLGNDHLGTADVYRSLGATYHMLGDFSAALQCRQQALDIRRKALGDEHASLVEGYSELCCTQFALADFSSAVESDQHALDVCIKMFGEEDPRTPCILLSLANTQRLLGDLTTALEYAECALCIAVRLFGTENVITARGYCSLGDIHLSLENHAVAGYYYQNVHNIDAKLFGNEHVNTLRYNYLRLVQFMQRASIQSLKLSAINFILAYSDLNGALQDALSALSMDVNLYGEEHVNTADSFYLLGSIHFELFDFKSSLHCHQRALDIRLNVLGEEHLGTVISFMFLALVHFALGNCTTAKEYAECALNIRPRLSEEDIIANFFECCLLILAIEHMLADKEISASLKNSFHRDRNGGV